MGKRKNTIKNKYETEMDQLNDKLNKLEIENNSNKQQMVMIENKLKSENYVDKNGKKCGELNGKKN